jgi:hypothetical protein
MKTQTHRAEFLSAIVAFTLLFQVAAAQAQSVYVTSGSATTNSIFGSLNLTTGVFAQIGPITDEYFLGLTTGAGGTIIGTDANFNQLYTINTTTGVTTQFGTTGAPSGSSFIGLAYSSAGNKFFTDDNVSGGPGNLYSISGNGNSNSLVGNMVNPPKATPSGCLAYNFSGNLYFNYSTTGGTNSSLYTVNTSTGALTSVGSLGTDILTLFSVGTTLYGIDTVSTSNIGIYTINTTTGLATFTGVDVTGLPTGNTLDTATFSAPDTGSTLGLLALALAALVGASRLRSIRLA